MTAWTDMNALCVALRLTRSRAEAAALIATWRAPKRPAPEPVGVDFTDEEREDDYLPTRIGARMVLEAIESPVPTRRRAA